MMMTLALVAVHDIPTMSALTAIWAYVGPDQILPLTSVLSALVGLVLMFWRWVVSFFRRAWVLLGRLRVEAK